MRWERMALEAWKDVSTVINTMLDTSNDKLTTNSTCGRTSDRNATAWYYITRSVQTGDGERQSLVERNVATRSV
jgi:hypothetical protein